MTNHSIKIGGDKFTCETLGVRESMIFDGRITAVVGKALKASTGVDLKAVFDVVGGSDDMSMGIEFFKQLPLMIAKFREYLDWDEFMELVIDSCEDCYVTQKGTKSPDEVTIDLLDAKTKQHYKLFAWYVECQLGPFIEWIAPFILSLIKDDDTNSDQDD